MERDTSAPESSFFIRRASGMSAADTPLNLQRPPLVMKYSISPLITREVYAAVSTSESMRSTVKFDGLSPMSR